MEDQVAGLLVRGLKRSPLRGDDMARWLYDALRGMDGGGRDPSSVTSLMPRDHQLDLFVTITDFYGYDRQVPIFRPRFVHDHRHRHALTFSYRSDGPDDFTDNAGLGFAARTTSCFPAVFPPVSLSHFSQSVNAGVDTLKQRSFRVYELSGTRPEQTYFVDGGILDNKPFGWAIGTIVNARPAESEVDRRLLYLEPDPGEVAEESAHEDPDTLHAALGALTTIPSREPILDDLIGVVVHNERVQHIRDIIEESFDRVDVLVRTATHVEDLATITTMPPAQWPWAEWNRAVNDCAREEAGIAYATYVRLKVSGVVDRFARTICAICNYPEESNHSLLVRAAVRAWAEQQGLFEKGRPAEEPCPKGSEEPVAAPASEVPTEAQAALLRAFDLGYTVRRLRFVIAALNWWYRCLGEEGFPSRDDLDQGKQILYGSVEKLVGLGDGSAFDEALRARVRSAFPEEGMRDFLTEHGLDGATYAAGRVAELNDLSNAVRDYVQTSLKGSGAALLASLADRSQQWDARRRRDLLVRYLGFPVWDVLLYPIQVLSPVGERDAVDVVRMSPHEATVLGTPPAQKVQGRKLHHFYAFFDRSARENDYLWGRLDGAEHLIRLLLESGGSEQPLEAWCKEAFAAILDEEKDSLTTVGSTLDSLRARVEAL